MIPRSITVRAIHRPGVNNEFGRLPVAQSPGPHRVTSLGESGGPAVPTVEHSPGGLIHKPPEQSTAPLCRTSHPLEAASDALPQPWRGLSLYAFPPIPLLKRTLVKIREDQADKVIIIAHSWLRRSWYHLLLQIVCEIPLLLPCRRDLLSHLPDKGMLFQTDLKTLRLEAWKLSRVPSRIKAFQGPLSRQSLLPLETQLEQCTKAGWKVLLAGVAKGAKIPFAHL